MPHDLTVPEPTIILELLAAFRRSQVMFATISLGVFDSLASGPKSLAELSNELGANRDALERLLDACVGLQLLRRRDTAYESTEVAATYLMSASPRRMTGYLNYSHRFLWKLWGDLDSAVREGTHRWKHTYGWEGPIFSHFFKSEETKREFLMGMHGFGLISSPHVVSAFDLGRFHTLVDLGGATGHLTIAACERYPTLHGVVFDLPDALPLAREIVGESSVANRIRIEAGDFFSDALPAGDLYAVGRILHDWTEEKIVKLLARIYDALPRDGALLIAEKLLWEDKSGPSWAQMQSLNMLVCTEGKERTLSEYEALLKQAGFREVSGFRTPSPLDAVLAVK